MMGVYKDDYWTLMVEEKVDNWKTVQKGLKEQVWVQPR